MQQPDPFAWLADELARLDEQDLRRQRRSVRLLPHGRCEVDGRPFWNFATNDYLGLAADPRLADAARQAIESCGTGARSSALVSGRTEWHAQLEEKLAQFKRVEAALLFPTGYAANVGVITSLAGPEDEVYCDRLNHASLIDGCRLSGARLRVYPHADVEALRKDLLRPAKPRRRLIVTDSLFSMDGDCAPLNDLVQLAEEVGAMLVVDEAHATGVFGPRGTGLVEAVGVQSPVLVTVGTLSKALGAQGGFAAGSRTVIDWLWNKARTQMFSTALAPPACAAALMALTIIDREPLRRQSLLTCAEQARNALQAGGWRVPEQVAGPIIPVLIGDVERTMALARKLEERGILVAAIRPPTVPKGTSRLRISLSAAHGEAGISALLEAFQNFAS